MNETINSHLVSRVVLRNFYDLPEKVEHRPLPTSLIETLEQEWGKIENDAKKAINSLDNTNVLLVSKHVRTLKTLIAIHYVRSLLTFKLVNNGIKQSKELQDIVEGFIGQYPQYSDAILDESNRQMDAMPDKVAVGVMGENIPRIISLIDDSHFGLEIGKVEPGSELVLGDVPVMTRGKGNDHGFVPITDASFVGMPITPKYLIALKKNPRTNQYIALTRREVNRVNSMQIRQSIEHCYMGRRQMAKDLLCS
jgi:hypothetical protein